MIELIYWLLEAALGLLPILLEDMVNEVQAFSYTR
jgi:hypothetical protein